MNRELLQKVIDEGVEGNLNAFFCDVSKYYSEMDDDLSEYDGNGFSGFQAIGQINFSPSEKLIVVTANIAGDLTERSGKKAQYEQAKKILKKYMRYDAGIFVFSETASNFRLSLVYGTPDTTRLIWSNFRRFTYFVNPGLTNKTFLDRVGTCSFSSLEIIKDAFSVEKVNKEFYIKVAKFFYRLTGKNDYDREMQLPSVGEDDNKTYEEFAVRLIGRSMFCWFLKHKKSAGGIPLIPNEALSLSAAQNHSHYYHSILEPLFFEVMNKELKDRKPVTIPESEKIPFLNGGLFEPHENDFYKPSLINTLKIPDKWFVDFFTVLEQYNFTIDENSTVDADVSVDPEMLGRIFENLLAEVNPVTGETARRATGSYYTPRLIVDYMVEQSLKQYLLTKTSLSEAQITTLLSYDDNSQEFNPAEKEAVVKALKEIRIIDPACGSGAFPMGILHRMLLALEKVDPKLEIWRKLYLNTYHPVMRKIIEDKLNKGNEHYIRKLTIIQDSIYGIDIQPIAVEISKLRCFLSLVVDELVLDNENNWGIEPLPNLEFKFISANSLIGLPKITSQSGFGVTEMVNKLKELREAYLSSFSADKLQIEKDFRATQQKLFKENVAWAVSDSLVKQLTQWDPFSYESNAWFDPEWMFGVSSGFDIVIANPPHGAELDKETKEYVSHSEWRIGGNSNSAILFMKRGLLLTRPSMTITYIIPKSFCYSDSWILARELLAEELSILLDISMSFENVLLEQVVFLAKREGKIPAVFTGRMLLSGEIERDSNIDKSTYSQFNIFTTGLTQEEIELGIKIKKGSIQFTDVCNIKRGQDIQNQLSRQRWDVDVFRCKSIGRYLIKPATEGITSSTHRRLGQQLDYMMTPKIVIQNIIAHVTKPNDHIIIMATVDRKGIISLGSVGNIFIHDANYSYEYLTALLNSTLLSWYAYHFIYGNAIRTMRFDNYHLARLPLYELPMSQQNIFIDIVNQILDITKDKDYLSNLAEQARIKEYEKQIDQMVYELYGLTPEEIGVVEGKVNTKKTVQTKGEANKEEVAQVEIVLIKDKETPGTWRFKENKEDHPITIYLTKEQVKELGNPESIKVTITAA